MLGMHFNRLFSSFSIQKWFKLGSNGNKRCPVCNRSCTKADARRLHFQSLSGKGTVDALRREARRLKGELHSDVEKLKTEVVKELKTDLCGEVKRLKRELHKEVIGLKTQLHDEAMVLKAKLQDEVKVLNPEVLRLRSALAWLKQANLCSDGKGLNSTDSCGEVNMKTQLHDEATVLNAEILRDSSCLACLKQDFQEVTKKEHTRETNPCRAEIVGTSGAKKRKFE